MSVLHRLAPRIVSDRRKSTRLGKCCGCAATTGPMQATRFPLRVIAKLSPRSAAVMILLKHCRASLAVSVVITSQAPSRHCEVYASDTEKGNWMSCMTPITAMETNLSMRLGAGYAYLLPWASAAIASSRSRMGRCCVHAFSQSPHWIHAAAASGDIAQCHFSRSVIAWSLPSSIF